MTISPELQKVILDKALGEDVDADPLLLELLDIYMNDKNSSTIRELITVLIAGYQPIPGKLDRDALDTITQKEKECKPKNFNGKTPQRGAACFNDYTRKRFNQDLEDDLDIVGSLFVDGQCAFVIEYNMDSVKDKLDKQIHEKCEVKSNSYVRSASWAYDSYVDHESLKIHYINQDLIMNNPKCMVKDFRNAILAHAVLDELTDKQP